MPAYNSGFGTAEVDPPDLSDRYNTALTPQQEAAYQAWGKQQQANGGRNPAVDTFDYDTRGFWQSGQQPAANGHAGDQFKKPNHPTFSNQSQYNGADGATGGVWRGGQNGQPWSFTPSNTNLANRGVSGMERYFSEREPGNYMVMPQQHGFGGRLHRDAGGVTPQNVSTQTPAATQQIGSFNQMSPEQLQETALRLRGSAAGQLAQRVLQQKRMAPAAPSAPAPSAPNPLAPAAPEPPKAYAMGGDLEPGGGLYIPEHGISAPSGFLNTSGPGRSDNLNIAPHADSYVLPADVVSGFGEGNSLAGAKAIESALHSMPYGVTAPHVHRGPGPPRAPAPAQQPDSPLSKMDFSSVGKPQEARGGPLGFAFGGAPLQPPQPAPRVPILAAGGEYIVAPDQVRAIGGGDIKRGHAILDALVLHVRKRTISQMRNLKGPVKS